MVSTLNNLEHVLQYISLLPTDLEFEFIATRQSVSSTASETAPGEEASGSNNDLVEELQNEDLALYNTISNALDHMDMVIYTVLETLQTKVLQKSADEPELVSLVILQLICQNF